MAGRHLPPTYGRHCLQRYAAIPIILAGQRYATKSRASAEARRRALWRQWGRELASGPDPAGIALALLNDLETEIAAGASARQARAVRQAVQAFLASCQALSVANIDSRLIQGYLDRVRAAGAAPRTLKRHGAGIRRFFELARLRGLVEVNPAEKGRLRLPRPYDAPPPTLDEKGVLELLKRADVSPLKLAVRLGLVGGLRLSEMLALRRADIGRRWVVVGANRPTKTGAYRMVPIPELLARPLARAGDPPFPHGPSWYKTRLKALTEALSPFGERGGRRVGNRWHLLRYTWTLHQCRGLNELHRPLTVWELLGRGGWTTPTTPLRHYLNLAVLEGPVRADSPLWRALGYRA